MPQPAVKTDARVTHAGRSWSQSATGAANNQLMLDPAAVACVLGVAAVLLILASVGGQFSKYVIGHGSLKGLVPLFYVNEERNIPTYFSVLLLLTAALLLGFITALNGRQGGSHGSKWAVLSFGFLFMAYDEAFKVHEKLHPPMRAILGDSDLGIFYFSWVIPGIIIVLVLASFFLKFLWHLPATTRFRFLAAGMLYVGGAIGVELIAGRHAELQGQQSFAYSMIVTVEESLEMAGLIVFIWALLNYCADRYGDVRFRFNA